MPGKTDLVNVSFRFVGASPIVTLTDGSKSANVAADLYDETLEDLLRSHPWNFATKRQKLAQSSVAPEFEFDHAYPLPSDWIRNVSVHDNDAGHGTIVYKTELHEGQRAIITSADEVWLRYVSRVTDPNLMPGDFRRGLALTLASDEAVGLAGSNVLMRERLEQARRKIAQAKSTDGQGSTPEQRPRGSWTNSRGGRRGPRFAEGN